MIIAIDPGASGAIAWCRHDGSDVHVVPMPETRRDTIDAIKQACGEPDWQTVCYHEKINPFIPDGGASMMFNFGASVERCGCIIETLGVRLIEIPPKSWQKELGLGSSDRIKVPSPIRGLSKELAKIWKAEHTEEIKAAKAHNQKAKVEWKAKLRSEAQRRYPTCKVTLKTCDALLILEVAKAKEFKA